LTIRASVTSVSTAAVISIAPFGVVMKAIRIRLIEHQVADLFEFQCRAGHRADHVDVTELVHVGDELLIVAHLDVQVFVVLGIFELAHGESVGRTAQGSSHVQKDHPVLAGPLVVHHQAEFTISQLQVVIDLGDPGQRTQDGL
jgi:hypothetical protein